MSTDESPFRVLSLIDEEPVLSAGGPLQWVPLRRRLGIRAFGTNAFRAARAGDPVVEDHVGRPYSWNGRRLAAAQSRSRMGRSCLRSGVGQTARTTRCRGSPCTWRRSRCARATGPAQPILEREAGEHVDGPIIRFRLACCHAQAGAGEIALEELRRAIELDPSMRERAATEEQLAPLRELEGWRALVDVR